LSPFDELQVLQTQTALSGESDRSIDQLDPMIDDIEERLCSDCLKELKEEEYYEEYQDADELDSMLGEYEGDW